MQKEALPESYVWRGIELKRVVHKERIGGSLYDAFGTSRVVDRLSDPPVFSGTVGMWRYTVELQADGSWEGKIHFGSSCNLSAPTYSTPFLALDFAAAWWRAAADTLPTIDDHALEAAAGAVAG